MPGPGVVTETTCWAGREECKVCVPATTGDAAEERGVRTGMTGLCRATANGLGKTGMGDIGADNAGKMVDEHTAGMGIGRADTTFVLLVNHVEARLGVPVC